MQINVQMKMKMKMGAQKWRSRVRGATWSPAYSWAHCCPASGWRFPNIRGNAVPCSPPGRQACRLVLQQSCRPTRPRTGWAEQDDACLRSAGQHSFRGRSRSRYFSNIDSCRPRRSPRCAEVCPPPGAARQPAGERGVAGGSHAPCPPTGAPSPRAAPRPTSALAEAPARLPPRRRSSSPLDTSSSFLSFSRLVSAFFPHLWHSHFPHLPLEDKRKILKARRDTRSVTHVAVVD